MNRILHAILGIGILVGSATGSAQTPPAAAPGQVAPTLNDLKLEFDIVRAELLKPLAALDELYRAQLEKLRLETQGRGKLEQVVAVRAEQARLDGRTSEVEEEDFPELDKVRTIYAKSKADRVFAMNRALLPLVEKQKAVLEALRVAQTQENRIDEAILTQTELDRVVALETGTRKEIETRAAAAPSGRVIAPTASNELGARSLKVRVQVDGVGHLHLKGGEIWFDHSRGRASAPGRHEGELPTYLNDKTEWLPVWNGNATRRHAVGIALPIGGDPVDIHLRKSGGRGYALVTQQPKSENSFTAIVELRDESEEGRGYNGSDWIEFRLSW